ncbi:WD40 repeat-like protein [Rickenella mellea]|uniref:WD40 repeat-like protein n=1 Tax=Rickenella mellea TaxID=50990 RepID=A0A4Y7Q3V9_9AGAM|nr:WD40 repeat-like protein [Rickenella mellea]
MAKHPRKKQKTTDVPPQPLGSVKRLDDDEGKDDEERRLESILFGKPYKPSDGKNSKYLLEVSDQSGDELREDGGGNELEQLRDTDLFFVDDGAPSAPVEIPDLDMDEHSDNGAPAGQQQAEESSSNDEHSSSEDSDDTSEDDETENSVPTERQPLKSSLPKSQKTAAWTDPDDTNLTVSLGTNKRLRKLRDAPGEDAVGGAQYEAKLRREYERIHAPPAWAAAARKKLHADSISQTKRRRSAAALSDDDNDGRSSAVDDTEGRIAGALEDMETLLASSGGIVAERKGGKLLAKGTLAIERLRDANQSARAEGDIKALAFHPSPKVPVLMVASGDRRLKLFNVDGHTNPHLQTIHIPSLPFTNALFHPTGTSILLTGQRPFYYTHDLQSGVTTRSPRGLWGSFASNNPSKDSDMSMEKCAFDASGEVLAVAGRKGYVHLVDWKSGGAQVVGSVKMNTPVKSLWWTRGDTASELMTLGEDAEVYVWNVGERRCVKRWKDDGGFGSVVMSGDSGGRYLGVGSKTGLVNVYGSDTLSSNLATTPKPLKTLTNLTTSISTLRFNHDSQLLAISSNTKKDQMRLIHLASLTSFSNWPTSSTPLGHVNAIDFSAGSEYIAVGNNRGRVLLYHLPHFVAH